MDVAQPARAGLTRSAHVDTFCRDSLPPPEQWPELLFTLPELDYPARLNCAEALLDRTVEERGPDRRCLVWPGGDWDYGQLREHADAVSRVLVDELGFVPGNRVLLRGPNAPWLVACWLGVLKAGGVVVTTMPMLRPGELRTIGDIARPQLALCDARHAEDLLAAGIRGMRTVLYGGDTDGDLTSRCARHRELFPAVPTAADDVALLAFTSGTTGQPKATMHFHRDVLAIADTFSRYVLRPTASDLFTASPPLGFTFGLGALVVFPLRAGAASLLLERASPELLADAVADHGVTVLFTAPTAYRAMLAAGRAPALGSLRRCVSAGETLPRAVSDAFHQATGLRIIDGIGATEMLHIFISAADEDVRPGSTGKPVPGYEARVLDPTGRPAPDGVAGRLAVRGPTGCRYLADPRQQAYVQGGWNVTGDTYRRDADGYFWYVARSDDMIVTSGYNIAGPEVENALLRHPDVLECGVVGRPDADRGEVVAAYVVLRSAVAGTPEKAAELQEFVKQQIAPYKYPRAVEFVAELPHTPTGKLQRFRLRERARRSAGTAT
ncbi:MAG TPA: AMP-binding protein [Mycobacteriales bacterium]|nr:AMP-binding protein [Mycobacteriales bacterium]